MFWCSLSFSLDFFNKFLSFSDLTAKDDQGYTLILLMAEIGQWDLVKIIASARQTDPLDQADYGRALLNAIRENTSQSIEAAFVLLDAGPLKNSFCIDSETKWTCLHYAIHYQNKELIQKLIAEQAKFTEKDNQGYTPLMLAVKNNEWQLVKWITDTVKNHSVFSLAEQSILKLVKNHPLDEVPALLEDKRCAWVAPPLLSADYQLGEMRLEFKFYSKINSLNLEKLNTSHLKYKEIVIKDHRQNKHTLYQLTGPVFPLSELCNWVHTMLTESNLQQKIRQYNHAPAVTDSINEEFIQAIQDPITLEIPTVPVRLQDADQIYDLFSLLGCIKKAIDEQKSTIKNPSTNELINITDVFKLIRPASTINKIVEKRLGDGSKKYISDRNEGELPIVSELERIFSLTLNAKQYTV